MSMKSQRIAEELREDWRRRWLGMKEPGERERRTERGI